MMLIELGQVPDAALPVSAFRDHLQLGSGFSDDGAQDAVLIAEVRAAIASVEKETGKALLERRFQYVVAAWRSQERQVLPLAPAVRVVSLTITDLAGEKRWWTRAATGCGRTLMRRKCVPRAGACRPFRWVERRRSCSTRGSVLPGRGAARSGAGGDDAGRAVL